MRSLLGFLRTLVLPAGAGPTVSRIELDGVNGEIRIYRGATLVGRWRTTDFQIGADLSLASSKITLTPAASAAAATVLFLDPPDSGSLGAMFPGQLFADLQNSDDTPFLGMSGPRISTETGAPRIDMYGSNPSSGFIRRINIAPSAGIDNAGAFVDIPLDTSKTADFRIGGVSAPRGLVKEQLLDTNSIGYTADGATDMFINNVPTIAGREYDIHLHAKVLISAAGGWSIGCHVNGTRIGELGFVNEPAGTTKIVDGTVTWLPSVTATTDDITVELDEFSGASTLTFQASADSPRTLKVKDIGKP